jgi:rod shape-determining protein MreD
VKHVWLVLFIFIAFLLQSGISVLGIFPNLTVLVVYYIGIRQGSTKGLLSGVLIGAVEDSLSSAILGPNMLAKGMVGFFSASFISGNVLIWTPVLGVIAAAFLTFTDNVIGFLSVSMFYKLPTNPSSALFAATMQSLINAPAGIFMRPKNAE